MIHRNRRDVAFARRVIAEAQRRSLTEDRGSKDSREQTETCYNCYGSGEVTREDGTDALVRAECLECAGRGWLEVK